MVRKETTMATPKATKLADGGTRYEYPLGTAEIHLTPQDAPGRRFTLVIDDTVHDTFDTELESIQEMRAVLCRDL
jgi:hypothetical protein